MTPSGREGEAPPSHGAGDGSSAPPGSGGGAGGPSPAAAEFLSRLARGIQRHGLYPPGHPALDPLVDHVLEGVGSVMEGEDRFPVAISPGRLVLPDGETDPDHPLFSSLAARLHDHDLARITFLPELEADELGAFMRAVSSRPEEPGDTLGARPEAADDWPHLLVEPIHYERLAMAEEEPDPGAVGTADGEAGDLWVSLARSVLTEDALADLDGDDVPDRSIVEALERISADEARARQAAARILALVRSLWHADDGEDTRRLRSRFVEVVDAMDPESVAELVSTLDPDGQRDFLRATTEWLPAGTVVDLLEQVGGDASGRISYQMIRLLSKLASYVELDHGTLDPEAETAFREQVRNLVTGWQTNIRAGSRDDAIGRLGRRGGRSGGTDRIPRDPERILQTALEVDRLGPLGRRAVDALVEEEGVGRVLALVRSRPPGERAVREIWKHIESEATVRRILRADPPDYEALDDLIDRLGTAAAPPMIDTLAESGSRSTRRSLFSRLARMEGELHPVIAGRLDDDRWFVQRNMLALLEERGERPADFSALPFTRHREDSVRREAYKLAFREDDAREEAVGRALRDRDPKAVSLALAALQEAPPATVDAVVPLLASRIASEELSPELRRQGVRVLGRAESEEGLEALLDLCRTRKVWKFWTTDLAKKSPLLLEALRGLAAGWADRPEAARVLRSARSSQDPDVRSAAGERESGAPAG